MIYTEIEYRLDAEEDPQRRKRLEQFIIEVVRSLPLFPVEQTVEIALQTDQSLDIYSSANLQEVTQKAERMTIRPAGEWKLLGYTPQSGARPIHLEIPREGPVPGPAKTEAHYLFQDMHLEPSAVAGVPGIARVQAQCDQYLRRSGMSAEAYARATHLVWATGGSMVPDTEMQAYLAQGARVLQGS